MELKRRCLHLEPSPINGRSLWFKRQMRGTSLPLHVIIGLVRQAVRINDCAQSYLALTYVCRAKHTCNTAYIHCLQGQWRQCMCIICRLVRVYAYRHAYKAGRTKQAAAQEDPQKHRKQKTPNPCAFLLCILYALTSAATPHAPLTACAI